MHQDIYTRDQLLLLSVKLKALMREMGAKEDNLHEYTAAYTLVPIKAETARDLMVAYITGRIQ